MHLQQVILNLIINAVEAMSGVTGPRECFREDGTCEPMPRGGSHFSLGEAFAGAEDITISTLLAHKKYAAKLPDNQCVAEPQPVECMMVS